MKGCTYSATLEELLKRPNGLLALQGRDGDGDDAKSGDGSQEDDDAKSGDSKKENGKDDDDKSKDDDDKSKDDDKSDWKRKYENLKESHDRNVDKRKEAEDALKAANVKIKQMEKDGTPDDAIKQQNDELVAENAKLSTANQNLMLQIAMRDDTAHAWVDPDAALKLADLSAVEYDEKTGKAIGLKAALDKLAKDRPFLLKPKDESSDDDSKGKPGSTGRAPAGGRNGGKGGEAAQAARLRAKYPGLRRG